VNAVCIMQNFAYARWPLCDFSDRGEDKSLE